MTSFTTRPSSSGWVESSIFCAHTKQPEHSYLLPYGFSNHLTRGECVALQEGCLPHLLKDCLLAGMEQGRKGLLWKIIQLPREQLLSELHHESGWRGLSWKWSQRKGAFLLTQHTLRLPEATAGCHSQMLCY